MLLNRIDSALQPLPSVGESGIWRLAPGQPTSPIYLAASLSSSDRRVRICHFGGESTMACAGANWQGMIVRRYSCS